MGLLGIFADAILSLPFCAFQLRTHSLLVTMTLIAPISARQRTESEPDRWVRSTTCVQHRLFARSESAFQSLQQLLCQYQFRAGACGPPSDCLQKFSSHYTGALHGCFSAQAYQSLRHLAYLGFVSWAVVSATEMRRWFSKQRLRFFVVENQGRRLALPYLCSALLMFKKPYETA